MSITGWKQFTPFYLSIVIVAFLIAVVGSDSLSWFEIPIALASGLFAWMLIEYGLHRFVFHYEARTGLGRKLLYTVHLSHHENPSNTKILSSLLLAIAIAPEIFLAAWGVTGSWRAAFYIVIGVAVGYFYYEWLHFYVHHARPRLRLLRYLRTYHLLHHHQTPELRFGVTTPLVDIIFKTFRPVRQVRPKALSAYVGQYELAPQVTYTITNESDKLFGQRSGRAKEELLPQCVDVFYRKGSWRGEKVFERDAQGRVIAMLDRRRENNDLVWRKVK